MGMAASQSRLLSLTGRLHDIELKAQNLESQKISLATQKDELYQDYCNALDATKFQVAYSNGDGTSRYVDATFSSLCALNSDRRMQYALKDSRTGNLIVTEEAATTYEAYGNDKYNFAWAMMGFSDSFNWSESGTTNDESAVFIGIGTAQDNEGSNLNYIEESDGTYSLYMTECEEMVYKSNSEDSELVDLYNSIGEAESKSEKTEALNKFRDYLYTNYSEEIFENMNINKNGTKGEDYDLDFPDMNWDTETQNAFNYYVHLWEAINEAGGCQAIEAGVESGEEGRTWLKNMVEAGLVTIQVWDDSATKKEWIETSFATSTNENYLQEVQDDTDLKKAEAKYEYELGLVNQKDKKFDNDLSKLETERSAITTEMDSIKQVRDDNVERTFGIFS